VLVWIYLGLLAAAFLLLQALLSRTLQRERRERTVRDEDRARRLGRPDAAPTQNGVEPGGTPPGAPRA
jgi:hypothetical protein